MTRAHFLWLPMWLPLLSSLPATAIENTLCNDGFDDGDQISFQDGFAANEAAAVKVAPAADGYPFTISKVQLFFGDDGASAGKGFPVTLNIHDDDGVDLFDSPGFPGTVLHTQQATLLSSPEGINEIVLGTPLAVPEGAVWISILVPHAGAPSVAADEDGGVDGNKNAIFSVASAAWQSSSDFTGLGDWIIRAVVDSPTSTPVARCAFVGGPAEGEGEEGEGEGDEGEGEGDEGEGEGEGALVITSVNPNAALTGESVRITIAGGGFTDDTAFRIGAETCGDVDVQNDGAALCTVPSTLPAGSFDVIAQAGAETFVFPSGFNVTAAAPDCACVSTASSPSSVSAPAAFLVLVVLLRRRPRRR